MPIPLLTYEKVKTKVIHHEDIRITVVDIEKAIKDMKFPDVSPRIKFVDYPSIMGNPNIKPLPPDEHKKLLKLIEKWGQNHKVVFTHDSR